MIPWIISGGSLCIAAVAIYLAARAIRKQAIAEITASMMETQRDVASKQLDIIVNDRPSDVDQRLHDGTF